LPPLSPRVRGLLLLNLLTLLFGRRVQTRAACLASPFPPHAVALGPSDAVPPYRLDSNVAVVKAAQAALDPWSFGAGRFALAALAFAPALPRALRSPRLRTASAELGLLAASGACALRRDGQLRVACSRSRARAIPMRAGYAAQGWGLTATSASHTAFLSAFTVILVPVIAASGVLGTRGEVPQRTWAAAAVAIAGMAVLELGAAAAGAGEGAATSLAGDAASLLAAALFAAQLVRTEHHAALLGTDEAEASLPGEASPAMALVAGQLATLAACFAAGAAVTAAWSPAPQALQLPSVEGLASLPWGAWLFTGLVSTAGTLWLELEALRDVSAPDAALVYATEPVWGAAVAAAVLGERWAGPTWLGAALIVGGSVYGQLPAAEGEAEPPR
jgi:drug/metabolite transporter (DMT)-like permease